MIELKLRERPEMSNRSIAAEAGVDGKTVKIVREELEGTAEIPRLNYSIGSDGKKRRRKRKTKEPRAGSRKPVRKATAESRTPILAQVKNAAQHRLAFVVGLLFGAFVPVSVWVLMHNEHISYWHVAMISGGAIYSGLTVYSWGRVIFRSWLKALGFVILLEGTMLKAETFWLSVAALALLVLVNSAAAATQLIFEQGQFNE